MPILTLREVDALRKKEEELGIVRDQSWAWVSGELVDDVEGEDDG